ncbi:hypothetical protein GCM10011586_29550 [Silvibacterium dinghuense]|nr:hypothetical protein GCM10011586_29550 [Silvibacterium dinghuense]
MLAETPVKVLEPKPSLRLSAYGSTEELHTQVLDLAGNSDLDVDLSEMTNLDASALQVLLALAGEQAARGLQLQMRNVSPALGQWLESTGAAQHLPASAQEERG